MADEIEITRADLGPAEPEFDIIDRDLNLFGEDKETVLVKVFVDGAPVKPEKKTDESISIQLPLGADSETSRIVVTTKEDKILNVLRYRGNQTIAIKDPPDDESTLKDIAEAIKKIAEAMPPLRKR